MQGRILVFSVKDFKLQLICEREVKGAVYNISPFQVQIHLHFSVGVLCKGNAPSKIETLNGQKGPLSSSHKASKTFSEHLSLDRAAREVLGGLELAFYKGQTLIFSGLCWPLVSTGRDYQRTLAQWATA